MILSLVLSRKIFYVSTLVFLCCSALNGAPLPQSDYVVSETIMEYLNAHRQKDNSKTLSLCNQIYKEAVEVSGLDSLESRFALEWLIEASLASGQKGEAERLSALLPQTKAKSILMGDEPVSMLRAYGAACLESGNFDLGKHFLQRAVIICARPHGPKKIIITETIAQFGDFLLYFGKADEGIAYLKKASEMGRKIKGESYRASMLSFRLAKGYLKAGTIDKAMESFDDFISFVKPQFPENDRRIANVYIEIARALEEEAQWQKALVYYKMAYKAVKASSGYLHSEAVPVLNRMAIVNMELGEVIKAQKILQKALSVVIKVNGTSIHPSALPVLRNMESIAKRGSDSDRLLLIQSRMRIIEGLNKEK